MVRLTVVTSVPSIDNYMYVIDRVNIEELNTHKDEPGFQGAGILSSNDCIVSYAVLTDLLIMASIARSFLFFYVCFRGSIKLDYKNINNV